MVGTELTRNKLYFENENDNNIKPFTLLEMYIYLYYYQNSLCKRYNYQFSHYINPITKYIYKYILYY